MKYYTEEERLTCNSALITTNNSGKITCKIIFPLSLYDTTLMKKGLERKTLTDGELSIRFERVGRGSGYKIYKHQDRLMAEIRGKSPYYVRVYKHKQVNTGRCNCLSCEWRRKRAVQRKIKMMNEKAEALGEW